MGRRTAIVLSVASAAKSHDSQNMVDNVIEIYLNSLLQNAAERGVSLE